MTTPSEPPDLALISYDLEKSGRRTVTASSSEYRHSHRMNPYSRASSTSEVTQLAESSSMASGSLLSSGGDKKRPKKMALGDLPIEERPAVQWARKRTLMDLFTTVVWAHNETDDTRRTYVYDIICRANALFHTDIVLTKELIILITQAVTQFRSNLLDIVVTYIHEFEIEPPYAMSKANRMAHMVKRRSVLLNPSQENRWQYFVHSKMFNHASGCEMLIVFGSETLEKIILDHVYASTYTPLRDEKFLKEINTTTSHMFSHVAVAAEYMIDKMVEEACGKTVRFLGDRYAPRQLDYYNAVEHALSLPLHKDTLPAQFAHLHQKGLYVLRGKSGLFSPEKLIYVPDTMDQLLRPRQAGTSGNGSGPHLQSSSAIAMQPMLQVPVPEQYTARYMTGDPTPSIVIHSKADSGPDCYGSECYEPADEDVDDTSWPNGLGYSI